MIYLDELPVKNLMFYQVRYYKVEGIVHEHFVYQTREAAEKGASKLSEKRSCELISSLPEIKSKKSKKD